MVREENLIKEVIPDESTKNKPQGMDKTQHKEIKDPDQPWLEEFTESPRVKKRKSYEIEGYNIQEEKTNKKYMLDQLDTYLVE